MNYKTKAYDKQKWMRVLLFLLCAYILYVEITRQEWLLAVIAAVIMLACFVQKEQILSDKGAGLGHRFLFFSIGDTWPWEDVLTILTDEKKAAPDVLLHIGKDKVVRTYRLSSEDARGVLDFVEKNHPHIITEDLEKADESIKPKKREK